MLLMPIASAVILATAAGIAGGGGTSGQAVPAFQLEISRAQFELEPITALDLAPASAVRGSSAAAVAVRGGAGLVADFRPPPSPVAPVVVRRIPALWRVTSTGSQPFVVIELTDLSGAAGRMNCDGRSLKVATAAWVRPSQGRTKQRADGVLVQEGDVELHIATGGLVGGGVCRGKLRVQVNGL